MSYRYLILLDVNHQPV